MAGRTMVEQTTFKQKGIGIVGLVLLLAVLGFVTVMGIKLVPAYLEYFAVKRALVNTVQSPEAANASIASLRKAFERRIEVDNIRVITSADVDISKDGGNTVMSVTYAEKIPLFANISACIDFSATSAPN